MTGVMPALLPVAEIQRRLVEIFPDGTPNRGYCTREIAAKTIFVMLYAGAVEGGGWIRPDQVTRMTDEQASAEGAEERRRWAVESLSKQGGSVPGRWYAVNTREPIRDETLREGLLRTGAACTRPGLATTSSLPRYGLTAGFARLFDPELTGEALAAAIGQWQQENLTPGALARIRLIGKGTVATSGGVMVTFPNGETRKLAHGPSSVITKAVVEEFAQRFLGQPGVIFLSESGNKVYRLDDERARSIGLEIPADRYLPDIVLVDLAPRVPLLVFVEVVATDGPVTAARRAALLEIAGGAGFGVTFVTAYLDRGQAAFRKTVGELAWGSFVWFAAEPDALVVMRGQPAPLAEMI